MFSTKRALAAVAVATGAALALAGCAGTSEPASSFDPDEKVTLNFTWWGNDDRAARYEALIAAFNEEYPNITINGQFTDFPSYWEKRQTEAAGGGLPDVWQFSDSYLRQYGEPGYVLDLATVADYIDFDTFDEALLGTGQLNGTQYSLPTGYSAWANFVNDDIIAANGLTAPEGGTSFEDFTAWMADVTEKTGGTVYGGTDVTQRIQTFELVLRAEGKNLYTEDGELGFTEDELKAFWESGAEARDGITVPQSKLEEITPKSGFGGNLTASETSWSNFLGGYLADSGASSISLVAPPTAQPGSKDLYRQAGLQMAISATTEHPEAAAIFLDYVVNSEKAGEIFGTTLGFPASSSKLAGAVLEGADKQVADYLDAVADRIGDAPPVPVVGYGALEQKFWDLGKALGLGAISVDDAVKQFFDEANVVLQG
ncbi:ABC transporter substrate-binding protein [Microbacterium sp. T2.11-28]|uniref:ABC transporter substrate-binding protein n=1 Tax=unclassified Microbacterium TaxID=2609290 RepID=UPI0024775205|nr:extracellular solute-binding protein [Microbacterium sp. T2.11-28]CAI9394330.1 Putative ABC transporter substrate-binding protein YesO [Microbacterium sp. T2.11-28]